MPLFRRKCSECKTEFTFFAHHVEDVYCEKCGSKEHEKVPSFTVHMTDTFKKHLGYWEALGDPGEKDSYVTGRKQLKEVCRKKGLTSRYLVDRC